MTSNKDKYGLYQKRHYENNKAYYAEKRQVRRVMLREKYTRFKATLKCALCIEKDPVSLDLHHFDGVKKEALITKLIQHGTGWPRIASEIEKCVCLCANHHRKVHAYQEWAAKVTVKQKIVGAARFELATYEL